MHHWFLKNIYDLIFLIKSRVKTWCNFDQNPIFVVWKYLIFSWFHLIYFTFLSKNTSAVAGSCVKKLISAISNIKIIFKKEADEKKQLYGSISKKEILDFLNEQNLKIKSDDLIIREPIKSLGEHEIEINPYVDVSETFKVIVNKN